MSEALSAAAAELAGVSLPDPSVEPSSVSDPARVLSVTPVSQTPLLSAAQIAGAFENWKRLGYPAEDFIKAARADGHEITVVEDARSSEEVEYDQTFAGATPDAYKVNWQGIAPDGIDAKGLLELDGQIRGALSAMNFPPRIGPSVMEQAFEDAKVYGRLDANGKAIWDTQQRSTLGRAVGFDRVDAAMSNARIVLSFLEPAFRQQLVEQGVFRSARVVLQLHLQAERWNSRADMALSRGAKK